MPARRGSIRCGVRNEPGPGTAAIPGAGGTAAGWAVLASCWGVAALSGLIWVAARIAAALTAGTVEPFGVKFVTDLAHGRTTSAWPHTPAAAVGTAAVVLLAIATMLAVVAARLISRRWNAPGDPVAALARNPRMLALTRLPVARAATGLRRSLAGADPRAIQPAEAGLALGRLARSGRRAGPAVYAGWRDTIVAFMAPGSGKTTAQAIPFVLSAPGAVIATSNKSDLWAATAALRAGSTGGRVWLFDPQQITYQPHRRRRAPPRPVGPGRPGPARRAVPGCRQLRAHPARRRRMAERASCAHSHRAARRRRVHRDGRLAARRAERRGRDA